jgi:hypothetical protein
VRIRIHDGSSRIERVPKTRSKQRVVRHSAHAPWKLNTERSYGREELLELLLPHAGAYSSKRRAANSGRAEAES